MTITPCSFERYWLSCFSEKILLGNFVLIDQRSLRECLPDMDL